VNIVNILLIIIKFVLQLLTSLPQICYYNYKTCVSLRVRVPYA